MTRLTPAAAAISFAVASICLSAAHAEALVADSGHEDVTIVLSGYTAELSGPDVRNDRGQITHWHSTDCSATWTVSVAEPSEVEVEVVAAVQPPFAGSRFELSIGDATLFGEMTGTGGWTDYRRFFARQGSCRRRHDASAGPANRFTKRRVRQHPLGPHHGCSPLTATRRSCLGHLRADRRDHHFEARRASARSTRQPPPGRPHPR